MSNAILLIYCSDRKGLVAAVTRFIAEHAGNIVDLEQHVDEERSVFFMRVAWSLEGFDLDRDEIRTRFEETVAKPYEMEWSLHFSDRPQRMAIFVSRLSHCLYDILARCRSGEWKVDVPLIVSNHTPLGKIADQFGIDFHPIDVTRDNKVDAEARQLALLENHEIDLVVLARYMQILSPQFVEAYSNRIINIHHSFLPAFPGARPYHSAFERGVKVIGATSHYVTAELDGGPIIEQDVVRVTHQDDVEDLVRKGRDLEKTVLSRAIYSHLQRKVLVYDNRTVVFA